MSKPTDSEIKEILRELTEDDPEFMEELITAYIENLEEFRTEAYEAVQHTDMESFKSKLHKINPTLFTLNFDGEYEMLAAIKTRLIEESIEENQQLIELIIRQVIAQLERVRGNLAG